jgi:hypothetical protein
MPPTTRLSDVGTVVIPQPPCPPPNMPTAVTNTVPQPATMIVGSRRTAQRSSSRTRIESGHGSIISHRNHAGMPRVGGTGAAWTARISA